MPEPVNLEIEIPSSFASACESLHLQPQTALQHYIDHLSVWVHFTAPTEELHSMASTLFKAFMEKQGYVPPPDACRELHVSCIQQLLRLMQGNADPAKKEKQYRELVNEWYEELTPKEYA